MSCPRCNEIQNENLKGRKLAFLVIDDAEVLVGACDEHFNKLWNALSTVVKSMPERRIDYIVRRSP